VCDLNTDPEGDPSSCIDRRVSEDRRWSGGDLYRSPVVHCLHALVPYERYLVDICWFICTTMVYYIL